MNQPIPKLYTNLETGLSAYVANDDTAFITKTLFCQLSGMHNKTFDEIASSQGVHNYAKNYPEIHTEGGNQGVHFLIRYDDIEKLILNWKPNSFNYRTKRDALLKALITAGSLQWIYAIVGYKAVKMPVWFKTTVVWEDILGGEESWRDVRTASKRVQNMLDATLKYQSISDQVNVDVMNKIYQSVVGCNASEGRDLLMKGKGTMKDNLALTVLESIARIQCKLINLINQGIEVFEALTAAIKGVTRLGAIDKFGKLYLPKYTQFSMF
jgi:hypothetical protein